ncbi:hypothetical protein DPMN_121376 [Dreissena polymorpha]|uniref:Uncharacterized protein n=1 Tax=Dreissena polymorpha TaxID=45954 RepID=A0A9D4JPG4_DREPO|nr:hypothetical protein DPMN_121376 [Dreissena polymorpha]
MAVVNGSLINILFGTLNVCCFIIFIFCQRMEFIHLSVSIGCTLIFYLVIGFRRRITVIGKTEGDRRRDGLNEFRVEDMLQSKILHDN